MDSSKPFKLVSKDRRVKKGIAARDLEDLVQKGRLKYYCFIKVIALQQMVVQPRDTLKSIKARRFDLC